MPSEIRQVIFTEREVVTAVSEFCKRTNEPLPAGTVVNFVVHERPSVRVELGIVRDGETEWQTVFIEGEKLAASLILYCRTKGIPLPATAHKMLRVIADRVAFVVAINLPPEEAKRLGFQL